MTLTDLLLWLGLAAGSLAVGTAIVGGIRWLFVRADARTYLVPVADRTVWLPAADDTIQLSAPKLESEPPNATQVEPESWALSALADVRKAATDTYDTLGEFARKVPTGHAWIGMEVEASTKLRELGRSAAA